MIPRRMENKLRAISRKFPVVTITGPRQSGKTTLARAVFPDKPYVSLEDLDNQLFAKEDPRGFLATYETAIIDEAQKVPELFSYLQTNVDLRNEPGRYIMTGSQNFLLFERISQSLAGRVAILKLLPFSYDETKSQLEKQSLEEILVNGLYPRMCAMDISPGDFFPSYIQTYVERDVRLMKNIQNLGQFKLFIKLCAGRTGQLLNLSSIGNECGISHTTARSWVSILEESYIVFLLRPHHRNFNKRLVKMPKLYFFDTGLAAHLLGIRSPAQMATHYLKGGLFESFVLSEVMKRAYNSGVDPECYFWRDKLGHEIDCLLERGEKLNPVEIKSGRTVIGEWYKGLEYFQSLAGEAVDRPTVVYGGDTDQRRSAGTVLSWRNLDKLNI